MRTCLTLLPLLAALGACGRGGGRQTIEETRKLAAPRPEQTVAADSRQRFLGAASPHGDMPSAAPQGEPSLAWDVPPGWKELPPTDIRKGNFIVPGRDRLQCYVSTLPGAAGGLTANLNRWRKQMGLGPMSDAEVAALPRVKLLGVDAPFLAVDGTYTDAGAESGNVGFRMAAVAVERPSGAVFVKMIGPSADVAAETDRFKALCASLRDTGGGAADVPPAEDGFDPSALAWTAPEGWTQGPRKPMRLVTFLPKGADGAECYVVVLKGTGGGLSANVNRWRDELGQAPLSDAAIAKLPIVQVLGRPARLVEIDGGAKATYGVDCELGSWTLFVKMTGPTEALRAERERFLSFCRSLN